MSQFPWKATSVSIPIYFHGTDGTIDKYGNPVNMNEGLALILFTQDEDCLKGAA